MFNIFKKNKYKDKKNNMLKDVEKIHSINELRLHSRYEISDQKFWHIKINGTNYSIFNLSYGGIAINISDKDIDLESSQLKGTLTILSQSIEVGLSHRYLSPNVAGFQFIHSGADLLLFLRPFLEHLRYGSTLVEIDKSVLKEKYQDDNYHYLRGEGPTDLLIQDKNNLIMTYRDLDDYFQLRLNNNIIQTGKAIIDNKEELDFGPPQIIEDKIINKKILINATCIFMGINNLLLENTRNKLLDIFINQIRKNAA